MSDALPPHNIEAEQATLGAALIEPNTPLPTPSDFYRLDHQQIADAMHALRDAGVGVELITVCQSLRERGELDGVGGPAYIDSLVSAVQSSANAAHYAAIVRERASERRVRRILTDYVACNDRGLPQRVLLPRLMAALGREQLEGRSPTQMSDALDALAADIESGRHSERIYLGIDPIDEMLQGVRTRQLVVIGGAPATGKSALAQQAAVSIACDVGPVGLVSQEMRADEVSERVAAQWTRRRVRSITKDAGAVRSVAEALREVHLPLWDWRMSASDFASHMRHLKATKPTMAAFVLDYVQLMRRGDEGRGGKQRDTQEHEFLQEVMPLCKGLVQELNCVGFVLAQLKSEFRAVGVEPSGESFRGPAILENADKAFILWRPSETQLMAKVVKNRQGPVGNVEIHFDAECVSFSAPGQRRPHRIPKTSTRPVVEFDEIPL